MDGPHRPINRSGDPHCFSKWDDKQQKIFTSCAPKPLSKKHSPAVICDEHMKFHAHARARGIHAHNCFNFCPLTGDPRGFTCRDNTLVQQHDVPLLLESTLRLWSLLIHAALQDVFPTTSTDKHCIIQQQHGLGHKALFDLI